MILKSINYWSYPGGLDATLPLPQFFAWAKDHGYEAVEVCVSEDGVLGLETSEADCAGILAQADAAGVKVASVASGLYWGYNLASAAAEDRQRAKDALAKMLQITAWLRCKTLLTIPGAVDVFFLPDRPTQSYDEVTGHAIEGLKALAPTAESLGVRMGIENVWNKFLLSPMEMARVIDEVGDKACGAYVDVGNILPYGYPDQWLRILGHRVAGVHFKDFRRAVGTAEGFVDLLEGDVDWPAVMAAIEAVGYSGPVVAELIPGYRHYPLVRAKNASNAMDAILGRG
ncbi:MAG: sugar phosphate isomerase/epimerase [Fimbriimonadaceae bacterium]|nr:sugar phosphate isomerase/epimerase [Fimbriimonadaceae bacterium]